MPLKLLTGTQRSQTFTEQALGIGLTFQSVYVNKRNDKSLCLETRGIIRVNNLKVLTTKLLEDVVQGHSNQVKDLIEAQKRYNS